MKEGIRMTNTSIEIDYMGETISHEELVAAVMKFLTARTIIDHYGDNNPFSVDVKHTEEGYQVEISFENDVIRGGTMMYIGGTMMYINDVTELTEELILQQAEGIIKMVMAMEKYREERRRKDLSPKNQLKPFLTPRQEVGLE